MYSSVPRVSEPKLLPSESIVSIRSLDSYYSTAVDNRLVSVDIFEHI